MKPDLMLRPLLALFLVLSLVTGVAYPLLVTGAAQVLFPFQAKGSVLLRERQPVGSALIGQSFTDSRYFWGRPSATAPTVYNGAASGGSNLGPSNPALTEAVRARVAALRAADPGNTAPVPVDLVTASASGLDPHISIAGANYQVARVAQVRKLSPATVQELLKQSIERPALPFLGEPVVNVLKLNLALEAMHR